MADSFVPTFIPIPAMFRGPSSSADYNTQFSAAQEDLLAAATALTTAQTQAELQNELIATQYSAMLSIIAGLESDLEALELQYSGLRALSTPTALGSTAAAGVSLVASLHNTAVSYGGFPSYYPASTPLSAANRAHVSPLYGQILPALASAPKSKAFVVDLLSQRLVLPPNVATAASSVVTPTIPPLLIDETPLQNAVDGNLGTYWRRNTFFPADQFISQVETTVTLTLPQQYVNTLSCNYVTIHPYPEFGVDLTSVVLHGAPGAGSVQLLPVDGAGNILPLAQAGKTRLVFPDTPVVSIDITMRQSTPNYVLKPGLAAFTVGASLLDFGSLSFVQSQSRVLVPFTLQNNFFSYVISVAPAVPGISYQLYALDPAGDLTPITLGATLPSYTQTVYVEVVLDPTLGSLPQAQSLTLNFYPVYTVN